MEAVLGTRNLILLAHTVADGIAVYIHDCVKGLLTTDELSMADKFTTEVEDEI
jgi:hypothetical protein